MAIKTWMTFISLVAFVSVGCSRMTATQLALQDANNGKFNKDEKRPACEIQPVEYQLDTKMIGFELTSNFGVHAGFNLATGFLKLLSVDFKAKAGSMNMNMGLYNPTAPEYELVSVTGKSSFWSFGASLDLGLSQIGAGFDFYHQTPIEKLAKDSLSNTFDNLNKQVHNLEPAWSTEVVNVISGDNTVIVPVGSFHGLKNGDIFAIYNVTYAWEDKPCTSKLQMITKDPMQPVAYGIARDVQAAASALVLLNDDAHPRMQDVKILKGAKVEVSQLTDSKRTLYRTMQIRNVIGAELSYDDGQSVDMTPQLRDTINSVAHDHGYVIYVQ